MSYCLMYKLIINAVFMSVYCCSTALYAESSLLFPETENDWCQALDLNCGHGSESKGIAMRAAIRVQFSPNSTTMIANINSKLDALGRVLNTTNKFTIVVAGYTDSIGNDRYNLRLSKRRAQMVRNYLINNYHIAPQQLRAVGYGERYPIANNDSEVGRSINRRVEFTRLQ